MKVSWDHYSQCMEKQKMMETTNQIYIYIGKYKIYCNHPQLAFPQPGVQIHGICGMEEMQSQSPLGRLETTEHSIGEAQNLHGKDRAKTQHIKISRFLGRKHECSKTGWSSLFLVLG